MFGIIRGVAASGVAIVYIAHRIDEVMHLADTVTVLTQMLETIFGARQGLVLGEVLLDGRPIGARSPKHSSRRGIALVTEDRKTQGLQLTASIIDNIVLPLVGRMARFWPAVVQRRSRAGP